MKRITNASPDHRKRPQTLRDFEIWLESAFGEIESIESISFDAVDEGVFEDVASIVNDAVDLATIFGCPAIIKVRSTRTPLNGKRVVGTLLAWAREKVDAKNNVEELMSKAAVAKVLHVSQKTVDNERQRGNLPHVKIGAQVRFRRSDIRGYIEANMVK